MQCTETIVSGQSFFADRIGRGESLGKGDESEEKIYDFEGEGGHLVWLRMIGAEKRR